MKALMQLASLYGLFHACVGGVKFADDLMTAYKALPAGMDPTDRLVRALGSLSASDYLNLAAMLRELSE